MNLVNAGDLSEVGYPVILALGWFYRTVPAALSYKIFVCSEIEEIGLGIGKPLLALQTSYPIRHFSIASLWLHTRRQTGSRSTNLLSDAATSGSRELYTI